MRKFCLKALTLLAVVAMLLIFSNGKALAGDSDIDVPNPGGVIDGVCDSQTIAAQTNNSIQSISVIDVKDFSDWLPWSSFKEYTFEIKGVISASDIGMLVNEGVAVGCYNVFIDDEPFIKRRRTDCGMIYDDQGGRELECEDTGSGYKCVMTWPATAEEIKGSKIKVMRQGLYINRDESCSRTWYSREESMDSCTRIWDLDRNLDKRCIPLDAGLCADDHWAPGTLDCWALTPNWELDNSDEDSDECEIALEEKVGDDIFKFYAKCPLELPQHVLDEEGAAKAVLASRLSETAAFAFHDDVEFSCGFNSDYTEVACAFYITATIDAEVSVGDSGPLVLPIINIPDYELSIWALKEGALVKHPAFRASDCKSNIVNSIAIEFCEGGSVLDDLVNARDTLERLKDEGTPSYDGIAAKFMVDDDGDLVDDQVDNCLGVSNQGQQDKDSDGVGDACDICPDDVDLSQADSDGDGVGDACDICPDDPDSDQSDLDRDGKGDACDDDIDADTILNEEDNCPKTYNRDQTDSDNNGIGDRCDSTSYVPTEDSGNQEGGLDNDSLRPPTVFIGGGADGDATYASGGCSLIPASGNANLALFSFLALAFGSFIIIRGQRSKD